MQITRITNITGTTATTKGIVLKLSDYGTVDTSGATDMAPLLRAAWADAIAAATNGTSATVVPPAGTLLLSTWDGASTAQSAVAYPANLAGSVTLQGAGRSATTFKLGGTVRFPVSAKSSDIGNPSNVVQNLTLKHFTVDKGTSTATNAGGALNISGIISVDNINVYRVNTINGGTPSNSGTSNQTNLAISLSNAVGVTTYTTMRRIRIRDCFFGQSGGGGAYGVLLQILIGTIPNDAQLVAGAPNAYGWIDDVIIEDVRWASGCTTFTGVIIPAAGSGGIMIGGDATCGKVRIRDCSVDGSLDVGYEIDSCYDLVVSGCTSVDARNSHIYLRNLGAWPNTATQGAASGAATTGEHRANWVVDNFTCRDKLFAQASTNNTNASVSQPVGLFAHVKDFGLPAGTLVARNIKYVCDGDGSVWSGTGANHNMHRIVGGFQSVTLENISSVLRGFTGVQGRGFAGMQVVLQNGRGTFRARNVNLDVNGSLTNASGQSTAWSNLTIWAAADYVLDIDDISSRYTLVTNNVSVNINELNLFPQTSTAETFTTTSFAKGWRNDYAPGAQALTDFTSGSSKLTPNASMGLEHRLTMLKNETNGGGDNGMVGPYTDGCHIITCTPPTTPAAGYKHGVRLKVDAATGTNSIHCYVAYDGTNYSINVDTEVAGVLTNRATTVIGASITSPFYVRGIVRGTTVAADYYTTSVGVPSGAGASSATYTLNSADSTLKVFGPNANQGYPGLVWTPGDAGSTTANFNCPILSVIRGRIAGIVPLKTLGVNNLTAVNLPTNPSSWMRIPSRLDLENFDMSASVGALNGSLTELTAAALTDSASNYVTAPVGQAVRAKGFRWVTPPAAATITASGSPFTYTNADGYDESIIVSGGTVSAITLTRKGGTASASLGTTVAGLLLLPGDAVTVTYTVAPTITKIPMP